MPEPDEMKVTLHLSRNYHTLMKELAKRRRVTLGNIYDQALSFFLKQPANFMGSKRERQLKKA